MHSYAALFRGINVGGKNSISMALLVELLESLGASLVRTYIQSGNALFFHEEADQQKLAAQIEAAVKNRCGFEPKVLVLGMEEFENALSNNPFPESESAPATLHLGFLSEIPAHPDIDKLNAIRKESERFELIGRVFYMSAPEGIGRSKLAAESERLLGVAKTERNWKTVMKIRELWNSQKK